MGAGKGRTRRAQVRLFAAPKPEELTIGTNENGDKEWRNAAGELHRVDGPAVECADGGREWWVDGKRHRVGGHWGDDIPVSRSPDVEREGRLRRQDPEPRIEHHWDSPAVVRPDGTKEWWANGKRHRDGGGPAIVHADGTREWWVDGKQHRENPRRAIDNTLFSEPGPAVEHADGSKEWWTNGKRHRVDGHAIEHADGRKDWVVDGNDDNPPAVIYANGHKEWWLDGKLHRVDGPAVERANGGREWWLNNELSRVEWADGDKAWFKHSKLHRADGPAVERTNGDKEWWLDGAELTEEEFGKATTKRGGGRFPFRDRR